MNILTANGLWDEPNGAELFGISEQFGLFLLRSESFDL